MKSVILNKEKLTGITVYETAPIGSVMSFFGTSAPVGWLLGNVEHNLKIEDYPKLYAQVKDFPMCHSDTEGYFKIPNLSDLVPQGANASNIGTILEAGLPNITGSFSSDSRRAEINNSQGAFTNYDSGSSRYGDSSTSAYGGVTFDASKGETKTDGTLKTDSEHHVYGNSDTVQPPAFALNYIIKASDYASLPSNAIDDTKATTGNVWSASKVTSEIGKTSDYSTEETVVGTWIDGKPIYRKVFNNQSVANPIDVSALNIETMIKLQGMQKNGVGDTHAMPYSENSYYRNIYYKDSDKTIRVDSNGGSGITWNFVILEYTKTTD